MDHACSTLHLFVNMTKAHINTTAQSKLVVYAPLYSYLQKPFTENSLLLISLVFDPFTKILVDCVGMETNQATQNFNSLFLAF